MGSCILAAVWQWWQSKFAFFLHWQRVFCFQGLRNFWDGGKTDQSHPRIYMLRCVVKFQGWHSRCSFSGVIYNLCVSSVSLALKNSFFFCVSIVSPAKKKAFSLRIHSKIDGSLHSRCGFAVVVLKIRIFSALTKGTFFFRRFVRNQ